MAETRYSYIKSPRNETQLHNEIVALSLPRFLGLAGSGTTVQCIFSNALSSPDQTTLGNAVTAHDPTSEDPTDSGGGGGSPTYTAFSKNLGAAQSSGTFDITGLSGLTADKVVSVVQTAAPITNKGNARDEAEMDHIRATGYVLNETTIRVYWNSPSVVVGDYNFAYMVSA